jgi:hypothetical protein
MALEPGPRSPIRHHLIDRSSLELGIVPVGPRTRNGGDVKTVVYVTPLVPKGVPRRIDEPSLGTARYDLGGDDQGQPSHPTVRACSVRGYGFTLWHHGVLFLDEFTVDWHVWYQPGDLSVETAGLEPATSCLQSRCSTN